ncbi:hypothetical protein, partial [Gluconobacter sphaericus]|uniref:hypothetical protein n=1 Tax=Gluconobacter sphaericus TaxID=574987 RepID=UPI001B8B2012
RQSPGMEVPPGSDDSVPVGTSVPGNNLPDDCESALQFLPAFRGSETEAQAGVSLRGYHGRIGGRDFHTGAKQPRRYAFGIKRRHRHPGMRRMRGTWPGDEITQYGT